ncbi:MAG: hypothetical protein ACRCZ2_00720, partial [Fusobacteriaceae bacterium]
IDIYFNYYIEMAKNGIYVTDYNLSGALLDEKNNIKLIDFDAYKKRFFLTKKLKNRIVEELYKGNNLKNIGGFTDEITDYVDEKIEFVLKSIGIKR